MSWTLHRFSVSSLFKASMNAMRVCLYFLVACHIITLCFTSILSTSALTSLPFIALEYLRIGEWTSLVRVGNHFGHIFHLFHSQRSSNFVPGSGVDSSENIPHIYIYISHLLDGFLPLPQVTWLIIDALELIHFKDLVSTVATHEITQREECTCHEALLFPTVFFRLLNTSSELFAMEF